MASVSVDTARSVLAGDKLLSCVAENGSAAHPYPTSDELHRGPDAARNLADAVYFLCTLYGRHPGVMDHAANRNVEPSVRAWFASAIDAFAEERALLTRLAAAVGPVPSTPGAVSSEAAVLGQRHAVEMLAQSERKGCALGAALAVVTDWGVIRGVIDTAARRFGVESSPYVLDDAKVIRAIVEDAAVSPAIERALLFGTEQIAIQHHGLWGLLEARQQARAAC